MRLTATMTTTSAAAAHAKRRVSVVAAYAVTTMAIEAYNATAAAVWPEGKLAPCRSCSSWLTIGRLAK